MRFLDAALRVGFVLTLAGPAPLLAQSAGGARCNDGTYSKRSGIGACWFSGGVASAPKPVEATPAAVPVKARPMAGAKPTKNAKPNFERETKKAKKSRAKSSDNSAAAGWTGAGSASRSTGSSTMIRSRAQPGPSITKHGPKPKPTPRGATARCMDGSYSYASHKRKACSKQGGVAGWLRADVPPE
jgi:uncharacterized protein DUF3761